MGIWYNPIILIHSWLINVLMNIWKTMMVPVLTHWGRVTHICVGNFTIIVSDNGLSPNRRQAIIWTNSLILLIRPLGTNFNEILIEILTFSFRKMRLKVSSAKCRPFCLGLNVLIALMCRLWCHCFGLVIGTPYLTPMDKFKGRWPLWIF